MLHVDVVSASTEIQWCSDVHNKDDISYRKDDKVESGGEEQTVNSNKSSLLWLNFVDTRLSGKNSETNMIKISRME